MKNVKRFSIVFVFAIILIAGTMVNSAAAVELTSSITLPWKTEYAVNDRNVSAIALAVDPATQKPLVAYHDTDTHSFNFAKRVGPGVGDCGTGNTWACWPVATTYTGLIDSAFYNDPNGLNSKAGFVYYNSVGRTIQYHSIFEAGGGETATLMEYASTWWFGSKPSIAFDLNGNPHVVVDIKSEFYTYVAYIHYTGVNNTSCDIYKGSEGWECELITGWLVSDEKTVFNPSPSITVGASNIPRIAFFDPRTYELVYAYRPTTTPVVPCVESASWSCVVVDTDGLTGYYPSIAYGGGKLYIAYYNRFSLRLAEYVGSGGNCSTYWKCITIDNISDAIEVVDFTLVMDGNQPVIAYQDKNDSDWSKVKLAQTAFRAGLDAGNCGPQDLFLTWDCQVIDQKNYNLGDDLDMTIGSSGLVSIVYLDEYDPYETHIRFYYQYRQVFLPLIKR